jgi:hypothetical protein
MLHDKLMRNLFNVTHAALFHLLLQASLLFITTGLLSLSFEEKFDSISCFEEVEIVISAVF